MENYADNPKWIMPPGLLGNARIFDEFVGTIFNSSPGTKTVPIMIYGPRGSGKTLLTNIFVRLYTAKHTEIKKEQIVRLNIAALPQFLVESELFGYVRGAFTGASSGGKKGLVEEAKGGILILEEIGELTKPEQAKLLTFIEDRIYYKVGDTKPQEWPKDKDIQIICTTNRNPDQKDKDGEKFFREDFLDRFYCYSLSPIHERRGDVLYHLFQKFPEVVQSLQPYQVMALLAYNWPGNVREIERVGQFIRMLMKSPWGPLRESGLLGDVHFLFPATARTSLDIYRFRHLEADLQEGGIRVKTLERELNKHGLGISRPEKVSPAFQKKQLKAIELKNETNKFGVMCYKIEEFEKARDGFSNFYCPLFHQNENSDKDLADVTQWYRFRYLPQEIEEKHMDLANEILGFFLQRSKTPPEDAIPKPIRSGNFFDMTFKELQRYYFKRLLDLNHGKIKAVAKQADLPESTCRDRLKNLGLSPPRKPKLQKLK